MLIKNELSFEIISNPDLIFGRFGTKIALGQAHKLINIEPINQIKELIVKWLGYYLCHLGPDALAAHLGQSRAILFDCAKS